MKMEPFDDVLPDEQEERHRELIALLRQAYSESFASTASEQEQAIQHVGKRLAMLEENAALSEETLPGQLAVEQSSLRDTGKERRNPADKRRAMRLINLLAAVVVVCLLVGGSILLFTNLMISPAAGPVGTQVTVHAEAGGLEMSMSITHGPYFLSEVVLAEMSLTNHSQTTFFLRGGGSLCFPALRLHQTGGRSPFYTFPLHGGVVNLGCNARNFTLEPGQTITNQQYETLTGSGAVMLTAQAQFLKAEPGGLTSGPLDGHWPSLQIQVASHIPSDRLFALYLKGSQVIIDAPSTAHLLYQFVESCTESPGLDVGNITWSPISTRVLDVPGNIVGCPARDVRWQYAVSAVGYAIVAGTYPA